MSRRDDDREIIARILLAGLLLIGIMLLLDAARPSVSC